MVQLSHDIHKVIPLLIIWVPNVWRLFRMRNRRHTFATRLNEAGVDPFAIRDLLGHSTTSMSSDYTHSSPDLRRAAIEAFSRKRPQLVMDSVKIPA